VPRLTQDGMETKQETIMKVTIELASEEVQLILSALAKLPLEQSLNTFFSVKNQYESAYAMQEAAEAQSAGGTD
jgi:hypothetical protein